MPYDLRSQKKEHREGMADDSSDLENTIVENMSDRNMDAILKRLAEIQSSLSEIRASTETNKESITHLQAIQGVKEQAEHIEIQSEDDRISMRSEGEWEHWSHVNSQVESRPTPREKLQELPAFSGKAEEWPLFLASYKDTTAAYGYSKRENLIRLQRCLTGAAKEAVMSLLIYPQDVDKVLEELQFRFGRSEVLVRGQLNQLRKTQQISEQKLEDLIPFSTTVRNMVAYFQSANCTQQLSNPFLLEELVKKLPINKRYEWAQFAACLQSDATVVDFSTWLTSVARVVAFMPLSFTTKTENQQQQQQHPRRLMHVEEDKDDSSEKFSSKSKCMMCDSDEHSIGDCVAFEELNINDRWEKVMQLRLCISCLRKGHRLSDCRRKIVCGINKCQRGHHKKLHADKGGDQMNSVTNSKTSMSNENMVQPLLNCHALKEKQKFLFKCVPVIIFGPNGKLKVLAIIDEGSSISLIERGTAKLLGLKGQEQQLKLQWYSDKVTTERSARVNFEIADSEIKNRFHLKNVRTISNMNLLPQTFNKNVYAHLVSLPLEGFVDEKPVLLLGIDNAHLSKAINTVSCDNDTPIAIETKLGWIAYGQTGETSTNENVVLHIREDDQLHTLVEEFFDTENFGVNNLSAELESDEDRNARQIMVNCTKRVGNRFETALLWKFYPPYLPSSYEMAEKRLLGIERKMSNNPQYAIKYKTEMDKYFHKGYARILTDEEIRDNSIPVWYLPHFGVQTPHKPDKLRIVFDAAAEVNGTSLNSVLAKGPEQAKSLVPILFKFRQGKVAVAADIREMFSQVKIRQADRNAQRFLWRDGDQNQPIQHCQMTSMVFGAACSPCCAEYVKNKNAEDFRKNFEEAVNVITNLHYVDDLVCSFNNEREAEKICRDVVHIHQQAGFELRNFLSNSKSLERALNGSKKAAVCSINMEKQSSTEKILGMFWNRETDTFEFHTKFHRVSARVLDGELAPTKRELLGIVMAVFDPYGMLADFLISSKILVQEAWKSGIGWDEVIPPNLCKKWKVWWTEFSNASNFRVPRCYSTQFTSSKLIQLHVFVDASQLAYAAVAYFRLSSSELVFVAGKTRTAPKKTLSIPRLELQSAVLGLRLSKSIIKAHDVNVVSTTFWSDSKTVIQWIHSSNRKYKIFVGHRIAEVLRNSQPSQWRWISTNNNPADDATRPASNPKIDSHSRWIKGPEFLRRPEDNWPDSIIPQTKEVLEEEIKPILLIRSSVSKSPIKFESFSSYYRLLRTTAWCLRFAKNSEGRQRVKGTLTALEVAAAEIKICILIQTECFGEEISSLRNNKPVMRSSVVYNFSPYLEADGLIRCHGRLEEAGYLPFAVRRPILMPYNHRVSHLIMKHFHEKMFHQNSEVILNEVRQKFLIVRAKRLLRDVQQNCMQCKVDRAKPRVPYMGQLPADRVTPFVRPFTYCGVDLFGPFNVAIGRRREKKWAVIFTCLTTRATHLELSEDLSTDAFLICFRDFVNRRGTPLVMRSDNGTNFVGAQKELKQCERLLDTDRLRDEATKVNMQWIFNCPGNPSSGGCWERLIQIVKRLLKKTLLSEVPRVSTLRSALIEAENILNARPLTDVPLASEDDEVLTPNHFLVGSTNSTQTPNPPEESICLRKQWRIAQMLKDRIWKQWTVQYLPQLLLREKWQDKPQPVKVNDLVIICDKSMPRSQWKKGRIVQVFPAKDGHIRLAEVKTASGNIRRPVSKLAVVAVEGES